MTPTGAATKLPLIKRNAKGYKYMRTTLYKLSNISEMNVSAATKRKLYRHYNELHRGMVVNFMPRTGRDFLTRKLFNAGYRCSACHLHIAREK